MDRHLRTHFDSIVDAPSILSFSREKISFQSVVVSGSGRVLTAE